MVALLSACLPQLQTPAVNPTHTPDDGLYYTDVTPSAEPMIPSITKPNGYKDYIEYIGKDPADPSFEQIIYQWGNIKIIVSTNAGIYSNRLFNKYSGLSNRNDDAKRLIGAIQSHFMLTSSLDHTFEDSANFMLPEVINKIGIGHALPIIWAVAIENITRPIPSLYGDRATAFTWNLEKTESGIIDPNKKGIIKIVVDTNFESFSLKAKEMGYSFSQAYYVPIRNEIRIYLDMEQYIKFYSYLEQKKGGEHLIPLGFISYVSNTFNDNSGHEIAHFFQSHSGDLAYEIPFISEGEALVQGFVRRRNGLDQLLIYGFTEFWSEDGLDKEKYSVVIPERINRYMEIGMSISPFEMDRIVELRKWYKAQTLIPLSDLLTTDWEGFYSGSQEDIKKRYLQSWFICLFAMRSEPIEENLRIVVDAIKNKDQIPVESLTFLEGVYDYYLKDFPPNTGELWQKAEATYKQDKKLAAILYQQIYVDDPSDYLALIFLGDILYEDSYFDLAFYYYKKSHNIASENIVPLARMGDVYYATGNFLDAKNVYEDALEKISTNEYESFLVEIIFKRLKVIESIESSSENKNP
jgi:hypothetical protein